ncbi:MAG: cadherin repeat domain-containing protein [Rhizobacter sp.]
MPRFLDDQFTRSGFINGSAAAPTGGNWAAVATGFGTTNLALNGASVDFGNGSGTPYFIKNSAAPGSADQTLTFEFTPSGDDWVVFGLLRVSGSDSAYQFAVSPGGGTWYTRTSSNTWVGTQIGAADATVSIPASNRTTHTVVCSVAGQTFSASIDGTPLTFGGVPPTDGTNFLTAAGVVGIGARSATSSFVYGDTAGGGGGDTTPPTITGPGGVTGSTSATSVAENTTSVHTFTANETVTWGISGGVDAARFSINSSTGALSFVSAPDFEAPNDSDSNNTYVVGVRATDGAGNATTQTLTVTVTNVADTAGSYVISDIKNDSASAQNGVTINWLTFIRASDAQQVLTRTNQIVNASGALAGSHSSLVAGVKYLAVGFDTAGTVSLRQFFTAT